MGEYLAKVEQIYQDRPLSAKKLKAQGKKIVGYFCCLTPTEILTAAGLVPFRIMGKVNEPIAKADAYIEVIACPYIRNCLDIALRGDYDFLDGFVQSHGCDNIEKIYNIWREWIKPPYAHFINTPHSVSQPSIEFMEAEFKTFKRSLERKMVGEEITDARISEAIKLHNDNRALVRELYELRKEDPPLVSGSEVTKIIVAVMSLPVTEANELLEGVIKELKERREGKPKKEAARLFIYGSELDNTDFVEMVEESGANVVIDSLSIGLRPFRHDVEVSSEPMKSLAFYYLDKIDCPRTYREITGSHEDDLENRFGHLRDLAQAYKVDGVICHVMKYCDTFALDFPDVKEFLNKAGFPVIDIEDEYTMMSVARLKTRIQAFIEMISQGRS